MTGKTHKAIGVATGVALVIYSVRASDMVYALGMATAPLGAMLPDIDHDRSKFGAVRKDMVKVLRISVILVLILSIVFGIVYDFILHKGEYTAVKCLVYVVPICVFILLADSQKMKEKFAFFRRHRGIMHTLAIPLLLRFMIATIKIDVCTGFLIGLLLGYLSHLFADMLTLMGIPLAYPISKKCISVGPVQTGTALENVVGLLLCVGIIFMGTMDVTEAVLLNCLYIMLCYSVAYVLPETLGRFFHKGSKFRKVLNSALLPIGLFVFLISFGLVKGVLGCCLISFCVGLLLTDISNKKKNH